jgi:hypothetical protein
MDGMNGLSAYEIALNNGFVGTEQDWLSSLVGPYGADGAAGADGMNGADGMDGQDGASAYQIAVNNGFVGTEQDWLDSLQVSGAAVTINNDTTSTNTFFPVFANSTTGNVSTIYTSNDKFLYKPSTGDLFAEQINADNGLFVNRTTILNSHTIAEGFAGLSSGPVTLANGVTLTISANSKWSVI